MGQLKDFLSTTQSADAQKLRVPVGTKRLPKAAFIALALVPKNTLPEFGEQYTPIGGSATTLTHLNIVSALLNLVLNGRGYFFGNGVVNGKRGKPKEMTESALYGTRTKARPTGELEEMCEFKFKQFYMNKEFFNELRANSTEYDYYMFTDKSVEVVRYDIDEPTIDGVGDDVTGNIADEIAGGFNITYSRDGQIIPVFGEFEKEVAVSKASFTFDTVTATTLVSTLGGKVFTMTAGAGGSLAFAVNEDVEAGVLAFSIFTSTGEAIPGGQPVTISSATGLVTVGNGMTAGTYKYKVAVENATGVFGEREFSIKVNPA
ncbi:hypothetical protein [Larkinella sp. C7]|uniref:hypothetical protein n=1 Tax=Larkinella sp. C7 TaxID=2576607 RepID=UPI0011111ED7|nr:hypothetical protein [Larkinella sp. C7]